MSRDIKYAYRSLAARFSAAQRTTNCAQSYFNQPTRLRKHDTDPGEEAASIGKF